MEIFISWSGEASHVVGLALKDWLPSVIQTLEPFISSEDVAKGTRWFSEIGTQLGKSNFGIICLTPENYTEPWILFEAGAISKSIGESSIAPILLGMSISELEGPLAQFNATLANKEDILKLMKTINDRIDITKDKKLELQKLEKIFEALWPELEEKINECQQNLKKSKSAKHATKIKRPIDDLLEELIELNRSNTRLLTELPLKIQKDLGYASHQEIAKGKSKSKPLTDFLSFRQRELAEQHAQLSAECNTIVTMIEKIRNELAQFGPKTLEDLAPDIRNERLTSLEKELNDLMKVFNMKQQELILLNNMMDRDTIS